MRLEALDRSIVRHDALSAQLLWMARAKPGWKVLLLSTPVNIVEAHDVVLAEIAADLHLDQFERDLAGIGEPMNAPDRDIDGFVFVHAANVIAEGDLGRSLDHYPMLGAMKVLLQRELASRLHDNTLHPVARGNIHVLVIAPWAIDAAVLDRRAMVVRLELLDQRLHLLGLRARPDQHGIRGRHHDDVV